MSWQMTVPLAADQKGNAWYPRIPIPADPALAFARFHEQAMFFDPFANPLGIVTTWSTMFIIGPGTTPPPAAMVLKTFEGQVDGRVVREAMITQFTF